jgi:hypothetical protein
MSGESLRLFAQTPGCAYYMLAPDARTPFHTVGAVLFLEPAAGAATQARVHHAPDAHVVADFHLRNVLAHGVARYTLHLKEQRVGTRRSH